MQSHVSLTIPHDAKSLLRASEMLAKMAADLSTTAKPEEQKTTYVDPIPFDPRIHVSSTADLKPAVVPTPPDEGDETDDDGEQVEQIAELPEVDAEGIPWDARIHSSAKNPIAKTTGCWKLKKKVDPKLVEQVKAELKAHMQAGGAAVAAAPTAQAPTPAAPPAPAAQGVDFTPHIIALQKQGKLNDMTIDQAIAQSFVDFGCKSLKDLIERTDLHDMVNQWFKDWVAL